MHTCEQLTKDAKAAGIKTVLPKFDDRPKPLVDTLREVIFAARLTSSL